MKEVWFFAACVLTLGALGGDNPIIQVVMALTALVFWVVFLWANSKTPRNVSGRLRESRSAI